MTDTTNPPKPQKPPENPVSRPVGPTRPTELGGPPGPEPTRYGDWECNGRCTDF